jgi:hypothetical protein
MAKRYGEMRQHRLKAASSRRRSYETQRGISAAAWRRDMASAWHNGMKSESHQYHRRKQCRLAEMWP